MSFLIIDHEILLPLVTGWTQHSISPFFFTPNSRMYDSHFSPGGTLANG